MWRNGFFRFLTVVVIACAACMVAAANVANAAQEVSSCDTTNPHKIVFVRGSGQKLDEGEIKSLQSALSKNLEASKYEYEELSKKLEGLKDSQLPDYRAVGVFGNPTETYTGVEAVISQSHIGIYRNSVNSGKELLREYILNNPDRCFVLVGYSQGAQVVGEVISELEDEPAILGKIKYMGLLGDPKLDLYGVDIIPGKTIPWHRGNAVPLIQEGILENRSPYVPLQTKNPIVQIGSWCYDDDLICTGNFLGGIIDNGHFKYPERAIPQMAIEIASVINNPTGTIAKDLRPKDTCGPAKQDIVVLLDTSPLMRRETSLFTDTPMYYGGVQGQRQPTAGEMLARVGCGDTRIAVVGYGRAQDGPPQLLLDFTKDPKAYDALMKSLYQPNASGQYERTQFREGALTALDASWRDDASKAIFAITDIAGSGTAGEYGWRGWDDPRAREAYLKDNVSQQLIGNAREKDVIILGMPVTHSYAGFSPTGTDNASMEAHRYLGMMTSITGGYMWVKQVPNYWGYNFKYTHLDTTLNYALQLREKTVASVASVRGKVGEPVTLKVSDTLSYLAAATLRSDSKDFRWYVDCGNSAQAFYDSRQEITFTPTKAQKCKVTVIASARQGTGAGCYFTCPEPFPPYLYRSFPFEIDIKPADYVPKIPSPVANLQKTINDTNVAYTWDEPAYNGDEKIVYIVRDQDGSVLAATTTRQLLVTDTDRSDPGLQITATGADGQSPAVLSETATAIDNRTEDVPVVIVEELNVSTEAEVTDKPAAGVVDEEVVEPASFFAQVNPGAVLATETLSVQARSTSSEPSGVLGQMFVASGQALNEPSQINTTALKLQKPVSDMKDVKQGRWPFILTVPLLTITVLSLIFSTRYIIKVKQ